VCADCRSALRRGLSAAVLASVALALSSAGCRRPDADGGKAASSGGPLAQARALLDQGQLDAALAKSLDPSVDGPDALCLQGEIWVKKAELAPLAAPAPGETGERPPEFKPEELRAIDLFERVRVSRPTMSEAHLGLATVLSPHAIRRYELSQAVRRTAGGKAGKPVATAAPASADQPDFSIRRIVGLYQEAVKNEATGTRAVDELLRFALRVKETEAAGWAHAEGISRDRENPARLVQFGDFLHKDRGDRHGAIEQYRQALIWRPDDSVTKAKLATLYIEIAREHLAAQQWGAAQMMFNEARKYVSDTNSPQGLQIQAGLSELTAIRRPDRR
jgi:hypothetical protein